MDRPSSSKAAQNDERPRRKRRRTSTEHSLPHQTEMPIRERIPQPLAEASENATSRESIVQQGEEPDTPPIPSYEQSMVESSQQGQDSDMLLALQLSMADSDDGEIDLINFQTVNDQALTISTTPTAPPVVQTGLENSAEADHTLAEDDERDPFDEEDDLLQALFFGRLQRAGTQVPPEKRIPIRDRYDAAGISTYRVDPRNSHSLYSRYRRTLTQIPQVASEENNVLGTGIGTAKASPLNPTKFFEALKQRHPVLNPEKGAPLVNVLTADAFLHILDFLYFPDAFALALTCKAVHGAINLPQKKLQYRKELLSTGQLYSGDEARTAARGRGLCDICLYELPESYFKPRAGKRPKVETSVCSDCVEFRDRLEAAELKQAPNAAINADGVWMVWRPNQRVAVEGTNGFLWYRRRA